MKRHVLFMLGVLVVIIVNALAFAQKHPKLQSLFDAEKANKTLVQIKKQFIKKNGLSDLNLYVNQLEDLHDAAKDCVGSAQSHLKIVGDLLKHSRFDQSVPMQLADYKYLNNKKLFYAKELSQCRLFVYRSEELMVDYHDRIQKLSAYKLLQRSNPIWLALQGLTWQSFKQINFSKVGLVSGYQQLAQGRWLIGLLLVLVAVLLGFYMRFLCRCWLSNAYQVHASIRSVFSVLQTKIVPLAAFGVISCYLNVLYNDLPEAPALELISHAFVLYFLCLTVAQFLFYPSASTSNLLRLPVWFGRMLYFRFIWLSSWLLLSYALFVLFSEHLLPVALVDFLSIFFVTGFSLLTLWFCLSWFVFCKKQGRSSLFWSFLQFCLWFFTTVAVMAEWVGYHRLVIYVVQSVLLSVFASVLAFGCWRIIDSCYECLSDRKYLLARNMHTLLGIKFNKRVFEFALLRVAAYAIAVSGYLVLLMKIWQLSENLIDRLNGWLFDGFKVANFHVVPVRFVAALVIFSVILLFGRFVATVVAGRTNFQGEEDTQIAVSTIILYVSFAIALVLGLLATGVDFTGLAIIAGALSVGIGLGLQNIVNNFVSGLILLLEKPIKPGDRVVVDDTEGFVKRIRIRSTQITTMAKEDVIVPNADLIANKVTNYMFRDRHWRIVCEVGVAYGSDVELVRQTLLEVAKDNNDVVHEAPNTPLVLFKSFGDSSLVFELWCVIYDVNRKYIILSDLNFAIDNAFRQKNITIAFPQRDLHIKDYKVIKEGEES